MTIKIWIVTLIAFPSIHRMGEGNEWEPDTIEIRTPAIEPHVEGMDLNRF